MFDVSIDSRNTNIFVVKQALVYSHNRFNGTRSCWIMDDDAPLSISYIHFILQLSLFGKDSFSMLFRFEASSELLLIMGYHGFCTVGIRKD